MDSAHATSCRAQLVNSKGHTRLYSPRLMSPLLSKACLFATTVALFSCGETKTGSPNSAGGDAGSGGTASAGTAGTAGTSDTSADLPEGDYTVFSGGTVRTVDDSNTVAEAVVVRDGVISFVGTAADAQYQAPSDATLIDLAGGTLVPGFIDAHGHFPGSGLNLYYADLNSPPIGAINNIAELQAALSAKVTSTPEGDWIVGTGYDDTLLAERRHPTRRDLDVVSTTHPIYITHISGHLAVVNSKALEIADIDATTVAPDGGVIRLDAGSGEPDGVLEETAQELVQPLAMTPTVLQSLEITKAAVAEYIRKGVTTAQSGLTTSLIFNGLRAIAGGNTISLRLVVWPDWELGESILDGDTDVSGLDPAKITIGAIKLVADGSIQGYTGYLSEPYHVARDGDASYRGYPRLEREVLAARVARIHDAGRQMAIHGNGDAAIDDILWALEAAQTANPRPDTRPIIIHAQMARDDQLDRMSAVGATPSFFQLHTYYWGDRHRDIFLGPTRASRISPTRSALDRGLRISVHADTPVVPMEPLRLLWAAINRTTYGGDKLGAGESLKPAEALRAITADAAWQIFQEDHRGSIQPGLAADFVILSGDPVAQADTVLDLEVLQTFVGGESVYKKD
jgi:predicted amidohydrolase YtcJ